MSVAEIFGRQFNRVGNNGYLKSEVDAFRNEALEIINKLQRENDLLQNRVTELNEFYHNHISEKEAIASAIIYSQSTSERIVADARKNAEELISSAKEKAKQEYEYKVKEYEANIISLKKESEEIKSQLKTQTENFIDSINAKAKSVIEKTNSDAERIIVEAKKEAVDIKEKNDSAVMKAKEKLLELDEYISEYKKSVFEASEKINTLAKTIDENFDSVKGKFDFSSVQPTVFPEEKFEFKREKAPAPKISFDFSKTEEKKTEEKTDKMDFPSISSILNIFDSKNDSGQSLEDLKKSLNDVLSGVDFPDMKVKDISFAENIDEDSE